MVKRECGYMPLFSKIKCDEIFVAFYYIQKGPLLIVSAFIARMSDEGLFRYVIQMVSSEISALNDLAFKISSCPRASSRDCPWP